MQAAPEKPIYSEASLQLVLFIDQRPSSQKQIQQIQTHLESLKADYAFELQVVDVGKEPYLAEHFKLVATPAIIKIQPEPRQTLAGSNLVTQLQNWWPRWQSSLEESLPQQMSDVCVSSHEDSSSTAKTSSISSIAHSSELIKLADEVFVLKKEKEELMEQLEFKDRVLALLAHDLRNPLTAASLALETLQIGQTNNYGKVGGLKPVLIEQLIKHARSQIRTMDRMITDILEAAKGASAELHIQPHKLEIGLLCLDILEQMKERLKGKFLYLETDIPKDLPTVYADQERIRQVVVNLLDNAIKYTPEGGQIQVSILHRTAQKIQVTIEDTGPGIPTENRDRIFEEHFRLQRDKAKEGYGLGLSLCKRIIQAHYGQIWVDSANPGSCFHFTLPVYR